MKSILVLSVALASTTAFGQVLFRVPLSLASNQCGNGRCAPSAYFDTSRDPAWISDWACGAKTYDDHDGVDMAIGGFGAMDEGRWVVAAAAGTVIEVHDGEYDRCTTANCGTANYIKIRHTDGKITWYWHLKAWSIRVGVGQWVGCGQVIANVGSSGLSTGPHLHFGVEVGGYLDDPYAASDLSCGGGISYWVNQGAYGGLPGYKCQ